MAKGDKGEKLGTRAAETVKKAGKALGKTTTKAAGNAAALNNKVIDQAEENTRAAFAAMRSAAAVKSVRDLAKVQTDFVKEQSARSMTQAKELGDLIAQFGRDAMAAWKTESKAAD